MAAGTPSRGGQDSELRLALGILLIALAIAAAVSVRRMRMMAAERQEEMAAEDSHAVEPGTWPCARDAQKFCGDVVRGNERVNACLDDHDAGLSAACSDYREETDPPSDWNNICGQELQSFCGGRTQVISCLRENSSRLTIRCAGLLRRFESSAQWRHACSEDAQRLCPMQAGNAQAAESCLRTHRSELSPSCRIYYASR